MAAWFVGQGTVPVSQVKIPGAARHQLRKFIATGNPRPVQEQAEGKSGLRVLTDTNRIGQFLQPGLHVVRQRRFQWLEYQQPLPGPGVIPLAQLSGQL